MRTKDRLAHVGLSVQLRAAGKWLDAAEACLTPDGNPDNHRRHAEWLATRVECIKARHACTRGRHGVL